jgi:hypothetical protein
MKLRLAMIALFVLTATAADAQSRPNAFESTMLTTYGAYGADPTPIRRDAAGQRKIVACMNANTAVGKALNAASWRATQMEYSRGGVLSFDEAEAIRAQLHNDTYLTREFLRRTIASGDVTQCNILRDRAVEIIRDIMAAAG